jgi:hypothetical protein
MILMSGRAESGTHRKRELLNKFAKCIGASLRHLVLSGLIFCSIKQVDENYFHITHLRYPTRLKQGRQESTQDGHTSGQ